MKNFGIRFVGLLLVVGMLFTYLPLNSMMVDAASNGSSITNANASNNQNQKAISNANTRDASKVKKFRATTAKDRKAAADRLNAARMKVAARKAQPTAAVIPAATPGAVPAVVPSAMQLPTTVLQPGVADYFGTTPNYANSPAPMGGATVAITGGGGTGAAATATVTNGVVTGITLTNGGTGYTTPPTVTITGGGGTGAAATALVSGLVNTVTVTNGGTGYTSAPTVTFTGGGGTGAAATATLGGNVGSITVTNGGTGYTAPPTVTITGGGGSGATATASVTGSVKTLGLLSGGVGYTAPIVTISGGGGTGATGTVSGPLFGLTLTTPGAGYTAPTVTFTGTGTGATATVTGPVDSVKVVTPGAGYTSLSVALSGGGGTLAAATATGGVDAVKLTTAGAGYTSPAVSLTGGGGTGAAATATGAVDTLTLVTPGAGYTAPSVAITGGGGTGATTTTTGAVDTITVVNGGTGYTAPSVAITGGSGTGATATAVVSGGVITAITFTPGTGYTSAPTVAITDTTGTGAAATATISVTGLTLVSGGTLYTSAPAVAITDVIGGLGTGATGRSTISVTGFTVTAPGAGYTSAPAVAIADAIGGLGTGAAATSTISLTGITLTTPGSGYTAAPTLTITDGIGGTGIGATAKATIAVTAITLNAGGSGYTAAPAVAIADGIGGTGAGAAAKATIAVTGITITAQGSGFTTNPSVVITDSSGGTGSGALAYATIGIDTVSAITVTNGGTGYTTVPTVAITGTGTGATATAILSGYVASLTLTNGGSGYTSPPAITFTDGGGSGAAATASLLTGTVSSITLTSGGSGYASGGMRKFVDSLPGLGAANANNLGQYMPVAIPDTTTYPGSDYYVIELGQFIEKMHSDLPPTTLRGYRQVNTADPTVSVFHYLGPMIIAQKDRPVRVKFINNLPTGAGGNLFIPTDHTVMGAGMGPLGMAASDYSENRATLHLHGGNTPWISDGTMHQWTTPAGESTAYPEGVTVKNVPDMDGGVEPQGTLTFYYTNQQSARLMFYHDHAYGITRLNVYAGEAAGYLVQDPVEQGLVTAGTIPADQIPLIVQDKTFVDAGMIGMQDPTWSWGSTPGTAHTGDLWFPHVYMPNQNPYDVMGANAMGRLDYGPWFWPPFTGLVNGPVANPYYDPVNAPWEPPQIPGTPNPSIVPEGFMDTPVINGNAYPYITVQPKAYRLRILNAANDRYWNLQLYTTSPIVNGITLTNGGSGYTAAPVVTITNAPGDATGKGATAIANVDLLAGSPTFGNVTSITMVTVGSGYTLPPVVKIATPATVGGATATGIANLYTAPTEVGMIPATPGAWPAGWPTPDARDGGFPDPATIGPSMIQIGTEGGFLPAAAVIPNRPIGYNYNRRDITVLNVQEKALFLGPAERADVIVDFSQFAGKTLILYNDGPAPVPAFDPRNDYYTGDPDNTATGGAPTTVAGYGPNTRTIMQIQVAAGTGQPFNLAALQAALPAAYAQVQEKPIVPDAAYNAAFNANYPTDPYVRIQDTTKTMFNGPLTGLTLTAGGFYASAPTVSITGGGGTGATATATVNRQVTAVTLTSGGTGYSSAPTVTFTGGGGTGAAATANLAPAPVGSVTVTNQGRNYNSPPTVIFTGGGGTGATARATLTARRVTAITVTNGGSGYTSPPTVTLTGGGGTGAAATAVLRPGPVGSITVTSGGSGYTSAPIVTLTGGGGRGATAQALVPLAPVSTLTLTSGGTGYTSAPTITFIGGGGSGAKAVATGLTMDLQPKSIIEDFDVDYGRMNAMLGVEVPRTSANIQTSIPYYDIDPPTEVILNTNPAAPIGTLADGTQIWKITHNGVDTHALHWHMFNVQLINRVGWDGMVKPPDPNELGWKETIRMNPLEDIIIAARPIIPTVPWDLPNSIRPLDVTMPLGSSLPLQFHNVDPTNEPAPVVNHMVNFGWEYLWHCHLLGHEENIMMRPMAVAVAPRAPTNLVATRVGPNNNQRAVLTWTDNSLGETEWTIQRAASAAGPWTSIATMPSTTGPAAGSTITYTDTGVVRRTTYYYHVLASNTVGDTTAYAAPATGYPTMTAVSAPTNTATITTN